jgi:hypothetical protein
LIYDFDLSDFFEMILILIEIFFSNDFDNTGHRPIPAERMLKNHARACRKLALPLQPVLFCGFFPFPTDSMLHTPGICE